MRLIGISGLKTSGKDTTYSFIKELNSGVNVQRAAFADKLKIMAAMALGIKDTPEELIRQMDKCKEGWVFDVEGPRIHTQNGVQREVLREFTGREYLQWLGANARTVFGDTFWIDQILPEPRNTFDNMHEESRTAWEEESFWKSRYPNVDLLVVTDVRYPNEAERIRYLGGEIWEVVRPGLKSDGHSSEIPLPRDLVDREIPNDGTITNLKQTVGAVLKQDVRIGLVH